MDFSSTVSPSLSSLFRVLKRISRKKSINESTSWIYTCVVAYREILVSFVAICICCNQFTIVYVELELRCEFPILEKSVAMFV